MENLNSHNQRSSQDKNKPLGDRTDDQSVDSTEIKHTNNKPNILLVEDAPIVIRVHRRFLELMNCTVTVAENGHQALKFYTQKPALILLDIGLPDISGINVCQRIRQQEAEQHTPIIALTAYGDLIEQECREAGIDSFAVKPISPENLYKLLCFWLPRYRSVIKPMEKLAVIS